MNTPQSLYESLCCALVASWNEDLIPTVAAAQALHDLDKVFYLADDDETGSDEIAEQA